MHFVDFWTIELASGKSPRAFSNARNISLYIAKTTEGKSLGLERSKSALSSLRCRLRSRNKHPATPQYAPDKEQPDITKTRRRSVEVGVQDCYHARQIGNYATKKPRSFQRTDGKTPKKK